MRNDEKLVTCSNCPFGGCDGGDGKNTDIYRNMLGMSRRIRLDRSQISGFVNVCNVVQVSWFRRCILCFRFGAKSASPHVVAYNVSLNSASPLWANRDFTSRFMYMEARIEIGPLF